MLTQQEIPAYMLQRHLISAESFVDGDIAVVEASRRNQNFKVVSEHATSYQLKQGAPGSGIRTVAHEAAVYEVLHSTSAGAELRPYVPVVYRYDAREDLLILELIPGAEDLYQYHARRGYFAVSLATRVGTALSCLHRLTTRTVPQLSSAAFAASRPWVLDLDRPHLEIFREISSANVQLMRIMQSSSELTRLLREMREDWRADALIHNDIKWDNCLVFSSHESGRRTRLKIIDWEFAAVGDPCWDVGSMFSNYLSFWLMSIPITGEEPPDRFLELSSHKLQDMQPAMRAYWRSYVRGLELDAAECNERLLRAVRYAAARLLQTAFEQLQSVAHINGNVICLVQLSLNILQRPGAAAAHLLGMRLPEMSWP